MQTLEYQIYDDKEKWGDGPWITEPDKRQYVDPVTGYPCLIKRSHLGVLCGYVGVPEDHPYFMVSFIDVPVDVHGGLSYSNFCDGEEERGICRLVEPGEPDRVWWLGYDCGHAMTDFLPRWRSQMQEVVGDRKEITGLLEGFPVNYKTFEFVEKENAYLAGQLLEVA